MTATDERQSNRLNGRKCLNCGGSMEGLKASSKFCCSTCRMEHFKKRLKAKVVRAHHAACRAEIETYYSTLSKENIRRIIQSHRRRMQAELKRHGLNTKKGE